MLRPLPSPMSSTLSTNSTFGSSSSRTPLSAWDLPSLLTPLHAYKQSTVKSPKVRPHYLSVCGFVYRNRYSIASQIQRRFAHVIKSDRTARRHLAELQALGWLDLTPTRGTSPLFPKVYHVSGRGGRKLREALTAKGKPGYIIRVDRRRGDGYSADHVLHEVLITEFMLMVWESAQRDGELELLRVERRSIPSHPAFKVALRSKATRLEPDAMFLHREGDRGMMCNFVEIDTGSMTKQQLKAKFYRYETWAQSNAGQSFLRDLYQQHGANEPRAAFRILIVVADASRTTSSGRVGQIRDAATGFSTICRRLWVTDASTLHEGSQLLDRSTWLM